MFQSFFDYENQNIDFNILPQTTKKLNSKHEYMFNTQNDINFWKSNKSIEQNNRIKNHNNYGIYNAQKYEKAKTKVKLIVYQNGFIMNNGEFRDTSFVENKKFLDNIEKGIIPNELIKKGIMDIEILLENKKNEIYYSTSYQSLNNNYYDSNIFQKPNQFQYDGPDIFSYLKKDNSKINNEISVNSFMTNTFSHQKPNKTRNKVQNSIYNTNTMKVDNRYRTQIVEKRTNGQEKQKKEKNFVDFLEFKKENDNKKKNQKEETEEKKKFKPFSGFGQLMGNINTDGLYVNKAVNTLANLYEPICHINIRLFNGEIIKAPFNYGQTVGDIYIYVRKVSGSDNFVLLEGFPPKEITSYGRAIYELGLQNTVITQKIN